MKQKIQKVVEKLVNQLIIELKKEHNIKKIQTELSDPIVQYTFSRFYPYILGTSIIFFLIFILAILIFILTLKIYKN